ncbi:MAG TPA: TIGR02265 family protein [Anaeromyxobacter sp.]|nr:TIGR02265 family protein [Anaeromyxobacter sp.]
MPTDRKDLQARIAATTPRDTARGLTFNALFDTLEEHLGRDAAVAADPQREGHRTEFFSYPVADFLRIAFEGADRLERKLGSVDEAFRAFGYRTTTNVLGSMMGATMIALAGKNGLRALLGQAVTGYRAMVSYGVRKLEWIAPRHARFVFEHDFLVPQYHCGVFLAAIDAVGAKPERIEGRSTGLLSAVYDIVWTEPA